MTLNPTPQAREAMTHALMIDYAKVGGMTRQAMRYGYVSARNQSTRGAMDASRIWDANAYRAALGIAMAHVNAPGMDAEDIVQQAVCNVWARVHGTHPVTLADVVAEFGNISATAILNRDLETEGHEQIPFEWVS